MQIVTFVKRSIQILLLLVLGIGLLLWGTYTYIDRTPAAQERLKASVEHVEDRVDGDASFWTKVTLLAAAWWQSDELIAEKHDEKALSDKARAEARREAEDRRFNGGSSSYDDDYYPGGN